MKHYLTIKYQVSAKRVKIVTVMPCYDKKLEAVRPNFTLGDSVEEAKEVDTVLATHELVELISSLSEKAGHPPSLESFNLIPFYQWQRDDSKPEGLTQAADNFLTTMGLFVDTAAGTDKFRQISYLNTTSNGYLEYVFRRAASDLFGVRIEPEQPLQYVQGKSI